MKSIDDLEVPHSYNTSAKEGYEKAKEDFRAFLKDLCEDCWTENIEQKGLSESAYCGYCKVKSILGKGD